MEHDSNPFRNPDLSPALPDQVEQLGLAAQEYARTYGTPVTDVDWDTFSTVSVVPLQDVTEEVRHQFSHVWDDLLGVEVSYTPAQEYSGEESSMFRRATTAILFHGRARVNGDVVIVDHVLEFEASGGEMQHRVSVRMSDERTGLTVEQGDVWAEANGTEAEGQDARDIMYDYLTRRDAATEGLGLTADGADVLTRWLDGLHR